MRLHSQTYLGIKWFPVARFHESNDTKRSYILENIFTGTSKQLHCLYWLIVLFWMNDPEPNMFKSVTVLRHWQYRMQYACTMRIICELLSQGTLCERNQNRDTKISGIFLWNTGTILKLCTTSQQISSTSYCYRETPDVIFIASRYPFMKLYPIC